MSGAALAAAAEALIGCPFRLHGRDGARGLDCVGLIACALEAVGRPIVVPDRYGLRRQSIGRLAAVERKAGLVAAEGPVEPGDILLVRPGPGQFHFAIALTGGAFVHAHAGLGRVVRTPGPLNWPTERHWRLFTE